MKKVAGQLRLNLAQFRELEAFAAFGSDLDAVSKAQLERGYRLTELLKQGVNSPYPVDEQTVSIYAGTRGYLDALPVEDVLRFEAELLEWFRTRHADIMNSIKNDGVIPDEDAFEAGIKAFAEQFQTSDGSGAEPDAEAQGDAQAELVDSDTTLPEEDITRDED
ncbi:MAG TPA: F0F1 ATP synthase subunit alpha, partial [Acidimicrobiaceae bacterium]|nr:F0F1 ATP synthase subunit alpha [Acidimicrobiaceae bacterium]